MKKINFIAIAILLLLFAGCKKDDSSPTIQDVTVGGLFSLTGNWSSLGLNSKAAIELAAADINTYFETTGKVIRIRTKVFDTKLDTVLALQFIEEADKENISFIVGPQSSAEVVAIKKYADDNEIIVVSQGSTAGSLAQEGDNIFRFCPSDALEGRALANTIYASGKRVLLTVARDDEGNKGLQQAVNQSFIALGGIVVSLPVYPVNTQDFSSLALEMETKVEDLLASYNAEAVGIYLASFDECIDLFKVASAYNNISTLQWYGGDGVALSNALIEDPVAAAFAASTKFFAPAFGLPDEAKGKWEPLSKRITDITGIAPDAFALAAYDAVWVWALNVAGFTDYSQTSFENIKANFIKQANSYYGATGATLLNAAGDRSIGSFDYWGIVQDNGTYSWKLVGKSE